MSARLERADMVRHATQWIAAWNRRDLPAVLEGFHEDASFRSPRAIAVTGFPLVRGKGAMEAYWAAALAGLQTLEFTLLDVLCDVEAQSMLVHYNARLDAATLRACELFCFEGGRKIYAEALYGDGGTRIAASLLADHVQR